MPPSLLCRWPPWRLRTWKPISKSASRLSAARLWQAASLTAPKRARDTVGNCYAAVAEAIEAHMPPFLWGMSAWMAADQLAASTAFRELSVSGADLPALPAGTIVVWDKGSSPHGHISIALGDGREASDHIAAQMTSHYGGGRPRAFTVQA